jgi:hypothetical protein
MILLKKQAGLLRSVRSWGALGLVLALVVLPGISNQVMPIEQALDQNHNGFLDDPEMLQALNLWVQQSPVPGTENAVIDDLKILELLQLWIKQTPIGQPPSEKWVMFWLVSTNQIARIRPDGTSWEILFPNPGFEPSPSRDGQWLTYTKLVGDPPAKDVFVRRPDGTEVNLTSTPGVDEFAPVWSWDGQMVAFVRSTDAREDIFKVNRDGSGLVRLTDNPASDHVPIWHPDNQTVVFMSDRDGNPELYKVDINNPESQGGPVTRLTNDPGFDAPGALSPNGSTLFWHSNRTRRWDIFKMAWDNPEAQGGPVGNLTNTPDQDEFVFNFGVDFEQTELTFQVHTETDNPEISVMRAEDGSNKRKLSDDAARPIGVELQAGGQPLQTGHKYVHVFQNTPFGAKGVPKAKVTIKDKNDNVVKTGETNQNGDWDGHLKPGTYTLEVEKKGFEKATSEFTLTAGGTENNTVTLTPEKKQSALETAWGLHTATFETPQGKIKVNLPDDMAAGDPISGTVIAEPSGETDDEKSRNWAELARLVLEIDVLQDEDLVDLIRMEIDMLVRQQGVFRLTLPPALAGDGILLVLKDQPDNTIASAEVAVNPTAPSTPSNWSNPPVAQTGLPVRIPGPNDVDALTEVTIGGENADILAQSPRKIVAKTPQGVLGKTEIEVRKGGETVHGGQIRAIGTRISAHKTTLEPEEQATLTVAVQGLGNLAPDEEVPVEIINQTPDVVRLEGGDVQVFTIVPGDPNLNPQTGIWTRTFALTGVRPGGFEIFACLGICEDECNPEGAVQNQRVEINLTNVGWKPGEAKTVVYLAEVLTYLPGKSVLAPGRAARKILEALPNIAMTRGFDVWARKCCQRCEKTWCFFGIIKNLEWVDHCSDWKKVLSGVVKVGDTFVVGTRTYTWEQIVKQVEDALRSVTCP